MSDCILENGVCIHCGWKWAGAAGIRRNCPAGIEVRTVTEQAALAAICRTNSCGRWDALNEACRSCGCQSQRHEAWLAKLRVGRCPVGKW